MGRLVETLTLDLVFEESSTFVLVLRELLSFVVVSGEWLILVWTLVLVLFRSIFNVVVDLCSGRIGEEDLEVLRCFASVFVVGGVLELFLDADSLYEGSFDGIRDGSWSFSFGEEVSVSIEAREGGEVIVAVEGVSIKTVEGFGLVGDFGLKFGCIWGGL